MKYVKKPIPIDAVQLTQQMVCDHLFERKPLPAGVRCGRAEFNRGRGEVHRADLYCDTLENSRLSVQVGCWIVGPGARGEYWPVQDDVFQATYMPAPETAAEQSLCVHCCLPGECMVPGCGHRAAETGEEHG